VPNSPGLTEADLEAASPPPTTEVDVPMTSEDVEVEILATMVNFIDVLCVAFTRADPKRATKDSQIISVFMHFWDLHALKLRVKFGEIDT